MIKILIEKGCGSGSVMLAPLHKVSFVAISMHIVISADATLNLWALLK